MDVAPCNVTHFCCKVEYFHGSISGWNINIFRACILSLTLISILFLMFKLRKSHHSHIPVYAQFIQLACVTFFFVVIWYIVGIEPSKKISILFDILYNLTLCAQWWLQIAVPVFMFMQDTSKVYIRRTVVITSCIVFLLACTTLTSILLHCRFCGIITIEAILLTGFLFSLLAAGIPQIRERLHVRPAVLRWAAFQFCAHVLFLLAYIFLTVWPTYDSGHCLVVVSDLLYYVLYAPLLFLTLTADSEFWRTKGALLKVAQLSLEASKHEELHKIPEEGRTSLSITYRNCNEGNDRNGSLCRGLWGDTEVAVKKLKVVASDDIVQDVIHEAKLLASLRHVNIIQLLGICVSPNNISIITEFMHKGSVFGLLHSEKPDGKKFQDNWSIRLKALRDVAHGMHFLHTHDPIIIHRDLKSHNLLVNSEWSCKVSDFGISRVKEITATMTQVGTPQWMAREVLLGERYSEKADIWSFGVVLWECVTLQRPFEGILPLRVVSMVTHEGAKLEIPDNCQPELKALIKSCFKGVPAKRPPFAEIIKILENLDVNMYTSIQ